MATQPKAVPLSKQELTSPYAKRGYQKAHAISIEAVRRFKNQDDRSFKIRVILAKDKTEESIQMKDDDASLLGFMKWTDIYDLHFHTDRDNDKFVFPEDNQPIVTVGWRGSGQLTKSFILDVTSPIKETPAKPTPTIPQRTEDDIRHDLAKIAVQYSIPEATFLLWIPQIGNIADAAKDNVGAQLFLDKFQTKCLEHNTEKSGQPPITPESARLLLSGRSTEPSHIDTSEDKAVTDTVIDSDLKELKDQKSEMDTWFPRDDDNDDERPAALTIGEQAVADVQAIKDAKDADVIEGEIVSEEPAEPTKKDDPKQESDFKKAAGEQVAKMINEAFPDATKEYKQSFFEIATGSKLVANCIDLHGPTKMFDILKAEIEKAKQNAPNLPASQNTPEKPPISNEAVSTPNEPASSNAGAPDATTGHPTSALTVGESKHNSSIVRAQPRFLMPSKEEFDYMKDLANAVAVSKFYQSVDTKEKALVIMMKGFILGIDPISALDGIYIINGKPYLSAKLLKGLVERTNNCQRFDVVSEAERCTVTIQRRDRPSPNIYTFTKQDAQTAGLWDSATWKKYPKDMLRNRCVMRAVKGEFPDVDLGPMANEEDHEFTDNEAA